MTKTAKKAQSKNKTPSKEYFFSWECIKNNTVNILVIVSAILLFNYFRTPSFKIDTTTKLPQDQQMGKIPDFNDEYKMITVFFPWFEIFNMDISDMDLSGLGDKIKYANFDSDSIFPSADKLPDGFNPKVLLENGKNPGLGVRDLHAKGITGKGITVAILDNGFNINHQEIKDNLVHYEIVGRTFSHFHGSATSSLLCGKTIGVAPEAKLVYFATGFTPTTENERFDITNDITALKKILNMNKRLPKDKRISAVSISRGWYNDNKRFSEFKDVVDKLEKSGVLVLAVGAQYYYGDIANIGLVDRTINADPDDVKSYKAKEGHECDTGDKCLLAPSGGRTTAGNMAPDQYIYWGKGGLSWVAPYIVGTWALAKQVYPDIKPKEFFEIARETGYRLDNQRGGYNIVIQPTKIIEYLQNKN